MLMNLPLPGTASGNNIPPNELSTDSENGPPIKGQNVAASGTQELNADSSSSPTGSATSSEGGILACIPLHGYPACNIYCVLKSLWKKHVLSLRGCVCVRK